MPAPLRIHVRMSFAERSDLYWIFSQRKLPNERDANVLRRMVTRYNQILSNASSPDPDGVLALSQLLTKDRFGLLFQQEYPKRSDICKVIERSTIEKENRSKLINYIDRMHYADFCKLIEAVENYYNGS